MNCLWILTAGSAVRNRKPDSSQREKRKILALLSANNTWMGRDMGVLGRNGEYSSRYQLSYFTFICLQIVGKILS